jgi:hypothetical protein
MANLNETLSEAQKKNRICPQPQKWNELYSMLPNKRQSHNGWEPPLPLILAAWDEAPAISKILRLKEHIEWAFQQGCLDAVHKFLCNLKEEDWYHGGD